MNKMIKKVAVAAAGVSASALAMADTGGVDTSAITTSGTTVATVGAAVFAVYVGIRTYKWVRSAL